MTGRSYSKVKGLIIDILGLMSLLPGVGQSCGMACSVLTRGIPLLSRNEKG